MSTSVPPTPVGFRVINQEHERLPDVKGSLVGLWTVTFESPSGVVDFIVLPDEQYNATNVRNAILDRVAIIEAVARLGSGSKG